MKTTVYALALCLLGGSLAACSHEETPAEEAPAANGYVFTVASPELKGMHTRALFPLEPEMENPIKNLALLVFDQEGTHLIENRDYYSFRQYADETNPYGQLQVQEPVYSGNLLPKEDTVTLCAVANVNQQKLIDALKKYGSGNTISLEKFKEVTISLPYYEHRDSVGLVKNIYMFGYHHGPLVPTGKKYVNIALGRIITRLNISLSVSDELAAIPGMKYAIRLLNTSRSCYVFPGEKSPSAEGDIISDPYFAPMRLGTTPTTLYYYVGPHFATEEKEATQIEIAYGTDLPDKVFKAEGMEETGKRAHVAICNDPPSVTENRDYRINRNCIYHIDIHLKKKAATQTRQSSGNTYTVELDI